MRLIWMQILRYNMQEIIDIICAFSKKTKLATLFHIFLLITLQIVCKFVIGKTNAINFLSLLTNVFQKYQGNANLTTLSLLMP